MRASESCLDMDHGPPVHCIIPVAHKGGSGPLLATRLTLFSGSHLFLCPLLLRAIGGGRPAALRRLRLGVVPAPVAVAGIKALLFGRGGGVELAFLGPASLLLFGPGCCLTCHSKTNEAS